MVTAVKTGQVIWSTALPLVQNLASLTYCILETIPERFDFEKNILKIFKFKFKDHIIVKPGFIQDYKNQNNILLNMH